MAKLRLYILIIIFCFFLIGVVMESIFRYAHSGLPQDSLNEFDSLFYTNYVETYERFFRKIPGPNGSEVYKSQRQESDKALLQVFTGKKPEHTKRIFVLGGSVAFGFAERHFEHRRSPLENILEELMPKLDFDIVTCGIPGYDSYRVSLIAENRYLDVKSPWKTVKVDRDSAAMAVWTAVVAICSLRTVLYPFLPFSSQKLHWLLGFAGSVEEAGWRLVMPEPGQRLPEPEPLFAKLDDSVVDAEERRLHDSMLSPGK